MVIVPLPPPAELEKLLGGLLMRAVKVTKGAPEDVPAPPHATALFATGEPVQQLLVRCDLPLAASLAAALSVVPPQVVKEAVETGRLDEALVDNLGEVMNVLTRFLAAGGCRFHLLAVTGPPACCAPELLEAAGASDERRQLAVEVPGYAAGRLELATL